MKHLVSLKDVSAIEMKELFDLADEIKKDPENYSSRLKGKCIILLFEKTSTRTRISFENGMYQLGGNVIYLDKITTNLHLGSLKDEIKVMSSYIDLIMARVYEQKTINTMARASSVPIINGLSDLYHPCQILSDFMTLREVFGSLDNIKLAWVGDGNNVCNSLIIGCIKLSIPIHVATPKEYEPLPIIKDWIEKNDTKNRVTLLNDPKEAVRKANVIYTDTFISMGQEAESENRLRVFKPYQVNAELISNSINSPYIMHCMPAHRGVEITDEIIDSEKSIIFQQAENRMHLQKALMVSLLE